MLKRTDAEKTGAELVAISRMEALKRQAGRCRGGNNRRGFPRTKVAKVAEYAEDTEKMVLAERP